MTLLFPLGLLALLALPIIVLLHLLHERRRRVVVPSLLLWQNVPRIPDGKRSRVIPVTLLLLLHLLVAGLIAMALGQPRWMGRLLGGREQIVVVLDTTTSMGAQLGGGTRLQAAQARARSLISGMGAGDSIALITLGPHPQQIDRGGPEDRARLLLAVDALRAGGTGADLGAALTLAEAALDGQRSPSIVVLSDAALPALPPVAQQISAALAWEQIGGDEPNRAIIALAAQSRGSGAATQVYARVANYDGQPTQTWLRLFGDDKLLDERFIDLPADGVSELTWSVPPGVAALRATLQGRDSLESDDTASLSLAQVRPLDVLLVSAPPPAPAEGRPPLPSPAEPLRRALAAVPGVRLITVSAEDYAGSPLVTRADLTVFVGFLPDRWPTGGVLVVSPPEDSPLLPIGPGRPIDPAAEVASNDPLLEGLNLASLSFGLTHSITPPLWASVILTVDGQPVMLRGYSGQTALVVWNFALGQSNLPARITFPLLIARTVRDLTPQALPQSLDAGATLTVRPNLRAASIELTDPSGVAQTLPVTGTLSLIGFEQPGLYSLSERGADGTLLYNGRFAVNAGSPVESDLRPQPAPQIATLPPVLAGGASNEGRDLWPWLALAALVILLGEWAYVHR